MIRLIVQTDDAGMAANVGGSVHTDFRSFDLNHPVLEAFLRESGTYVVRRLVGCELLDASGTQEPLR